MTARVTWNASAAVRGTRAGALRGLRLAVEYLLEESRQLVPIEEGTLERSGTATVDEGSLTGAVAYDTPYAVAQHERLDYQHDAGRTAKYLERPLLDGQQTMREIIAAQVRRALR